jgi:replication-associated recombination protein RarA
LCTVLKDELLYLACFLNYEQKRLMADSSYQVIARRWRPQQFSELVGQDHVVKNSW